jgi:site-specific recombinase XerD
MFRSTFASNLVMSGVDIYAVSKLLGHHDVKITEKHYAHLTPDFLSHSVQRLNFEFGQTT